MALRAEMASIFRTKLAALTVNLSSIKSELQAVKAELSPNITTTQSTVRALKETVGKMETSLFSCSDDLVWPQAKVKQLTVDLKRLDDKCDDLEARSRHNNIRLIGVPENFSTTNMSTAISALLKDALQLEKEPAIHRAHRTLQRKPKSGERLRPIIARLHNYTDCVDILRRAKTSQQIKTNGMCLSIFLDYTPKISRARSAFNDVHQQLHEILEIRFGLLYPARL